MTDPRHHDASPMLVLVLGTICLVVTFIVMSAVKARAETEADTVKKLKAEISELRKQIVTNDLNWAQAIKDWQAKKTQLVEKADTLDFRVDVLTEDHIEQLQKDGK